jgi:glycogen operon protein
MTRSDRGPGEGIGRGRPYPLGATYDGVGTNFSLFSEVAERVELCLFDEAGNEERYALPEETAYLHHGYLRGVGPGKRYGYRVTGPFDPPAGHRCDPSKLLLDPYGKAVEGEVRWEDSLYDAPTAGGAAPPDSAPVMPRSVVISPFFDWGNDRRPETPWHNTVVYEMHVKGFTAAHPDVPPELRGTYAGLASDGAVGHIKSLGVTAVELQPVHQFVHDRELVERGLRNYWGYNSICYLAPHNEYSAAGDRGQQVQEFKQLVKTLHGAGIEVILDVVYNHTAEGNQEGPTLSFKGIDNAAYYRLDSEDRSRYVDYTGTGNTLNARHPHVLQLLMDSLRYWVLEMHVDGFRFDLAATLARTLHDVDRLSAFFDIIQQDPVISQVKLIAEPWDVGEGGYQVGNFPPLWSEWNGKYRDCIRDYWRGTERTLPEMAFRLMGSSDLYGHTGRKPWASVNFVTCHDGFTLTDLVSYNEKHNAANGEDNRDGTDSNNSWNCGVEGPTGDPAVNALRARQKRNLLATLFLSQGVPMLLSGDEIGRTQQGNNNAYCQDNEVSWLDWERADQDLLRFTRKLGALRRDHGAFRRRTWFRSGTPLGQDSDEIAWFTPDGTMMTEGDWEADFAKSIAVRLTGKAPTTNGGRGTDVDGGPPGEQFYLVFNAYWDPIGFVLPRDDVRVWSRVLDTARPDDPFFDVDPAPLEPGESVRAEGRSVVVLRSDRPGA